MNWKTFDNLSRFCYDCAKVSFAVLIIGALAKTEGFKWQSVLFGLLFTILLIMGGIMFDLLQGEED